MNRLGSGEEERDSLRDKGFERDRVMEEKVSDRLSVGERGVDVERDRARDIERDRARDIERDRARDVERDRTRDIERDRVRDMEWHQEQRWK